MSILSVPGAKETALELNSLSKSQNMAGWRVGLLASGKEIVDAVMRFKSNMDSGMFLPIQLAAAKALGLGRDWYDQVNEVYRNRRKIVFELLDLLDTDYSEEQAGMFVWARIPSAYKNGYELSDEILNTAAVFITPGGIFGAAGDPYIRISLCSPEEKFREAIARIQQSKKISAPLEQALNK
jgi:aspartate/methionine/tyrosine aminotransferase